MKGIGTWWSEERPQGSEERLPLAKDRFSPKPDIHLFDFFQANCFPTDLATTSLNRGAKWRSRDDSAAAPTLAPAYPHSINKD